MLTQADIYRLPFMAALLKLLNFSPPRDRLHEQHRRLRYRRRSSISKSWRSMAMPLAWKEAGK